MRNIVAALAACLALTGCSKRLTEPVRTQFYFACISSGVPVTACMCLEKKGIATSGIDRIQANGDEAKAQKFMEAVKAAGTACREETLKDIANDIDEATQVLQDAQGG